MIFKCPYPECEKSYGSDISLNLHIKLKHYGGTKTQRELAVRTFIMSHVEGISPAPMEWCFPPGYIGQMWLTIQEELKKRTYNKVGDDRIREVSKILDREEEKNTQKITYCNKHGLSLIHI